MKYYDKLIFELSKPGRIGYSLPDFFSDADQQQLPLGNRATLGTVRGRGPSSDGRGPAQQDVLGGSWPPPPQIRVMFWPQNWRKGGLQERRNKVIREQGFYNQAWCGCEFSRNVNP